MLHIADSVVKFYFTMHQIDGTRISGYCSHSRNLFLFSKASDHSEENLACLLNIALIQRTVLHNALLLRKSRLIVLQNVPYKSPLRGQVVTVMSEILQL